MFKILKAFISDSTVKIVWSGVKPARVQQYDVVCDVLRIIVLYCRSLLDAAFELGFDFTTKPF